MREGQVPPGFRSTVSGEGKPGDWRVVMDEVASEMPPLSPQAPVTSKRAVLGQMAMQMKDEHFPMLVFEEETFRDFTLTTRFKTVSGVMEQMAGIVFRAQNESNYYVLRASSLGSTFRFYKVVDGQRQPEVIQAKLPIPQGVWHEMSVECKGNTIRCFLNGKEVIPVLQDSSFSTGKIGFWTKSDSVSYFSDTRIVYVRQEPSAQKIVTDLLKKYPRLLGMKIYVRGAEAGTTKVVGSKNAADLGQPGTKTESEVIGRAETWYGKEKNEVSVIMPLRDRNGEVLGAARIVMKTFRGQTEENAIIRAAPIVKEIQARVNSLEDLVE
jgi:hypothetical protein